MAMTIEQELLAFYLDDGGWHDEAANVRNGIDLESYESDLRIIDWMRRHHLTQPAQAVDGEHIAMLREMLAGYGDSGFSAERAALESAIRALSAEKAGWRDIATAPNDGTVVLLAIEKPGYSGMALAYQKDGQWHSEESDAAFGGWTHWMPLPASPAPDKEG